jgi:uncharacterized membrane protein YedE/YeeE
MSYWPWWAGALALGTVAVGYWLVVGRLLGVSGSFARSLEGPDADEDEYGTPDVEALLAATREEFGDDAVGGAEASPAPPPAPAPARRSSYGSHLALLAAVLVGGAIGAITRGAWHLRFDLGAEFTHLFGGGGRGMATLLLGGILVGFGTQMAGGCTSGHGLCGTSRLQPGSLLATASFFGAAVGVSLLLARLS